jgi:hypothetical protein
MAPPHIPSELYPNIIQFIPIDDASTHISLSVVSRAFRYAAERALYSDIGLDLLNADACSALWSSLMKPLAGHGPLCRTSYVRVLSIFGGEDDTNPSPISTLSAIKHLTNLRELHWNCPPIPGSAEALFGGGQCPFQLEKMAWSRLDASENLALNTFLGTQHRLTHLSVVLDNPDQPWADFPPPPLLPTVRWLEVDGRGCASVLTRCQNVVDLTLVWAGGRTFDDTELEPLRPSLRRLRSFTVEYNHLQGSVQSAIGRLLPSLESLKRLCVRYYNQFSKTKLANYLSSLNISAIPSPSLQRIRIIIAEPGPDLNDYQVIIGLQAPVWLKERSTLKVVECGDMDKDWEEVVTKRFSRSTNEVASGYLNPLALAKLPQMITNTSHHGRVPVENALLTSSSWA